MVVNIKRNQIKRDSIFPFGENSLRVRYINIIYKLWSIFVIIIKLIIIILKILRNMTFLALLDISGERTIVFHVLFHSTDRSSKKFSPTGVTKIVNKRNFATVNYIPCIISTTSILCFIDFSTMTRLNYRSLRSCTWKFLVKVVAEVLP